MIIFPNGVCRVWCFHKFLVSWTNIVVCRECYLFFEHKHKLIYNH